MAERTAPQRVPAALGGERLDRVVSILAECSRSVAAGLVAGGDVEVNGDVVRTRSHRLATDDEVSWSRPEEPDRTIEGDPDIPLTVCHEDSDVVVVDKPPGLVCHPGAGHDRGTLVHALVARYPEVAQVGDPHRPGLVHRLDRDTSGLLVVARTEDARRDLSDQLAARTVDRRYDALVWGRPETASGVVDAPIGRSPRSPLRMAVAQSGRPARTGYVEREVFRSPVEVTRLECRLETGRTHQIRVHLAAIGHPVVGDALYDGVRQSLPAPRQWLHAEHLGFRHPRSGAHLAFDSPVPADLRRVLEGLS